MILEEALVEALWPRNYFFGKGCDAEHQSWKGGDARHRTLIKRKEVRKGKRG
jgi:hypothetical protein